MEQATDVTGRGQTTILGRLFDLARSGIRALTFQGHTATRYRSRWWFLLPILGNIIGGMIAYCAIRHDDPDKAKNCILLGVAIFLLYTWPLFAVALFMLSD